MGATSSALEEAPSPGRKLLTSYFKTKSKKDIDIPTFTLKSIFQEYDTNQTGFLEYDEALLFLSDFLTANGLKAMIKQNLQKSPTRVSREDWSAFYEDFLVAFLDEIDPIGANKISLDQFMDTLNKDWNDFMKKLIGDGITQRQFNRKMRESKIKKATERKDVSSESITERSNTSSKSGTSSKSKKKKKTTPEKGESQLSDNVEEDIDEKEREAIDEIWDDHLQEEEREKKLEQEAIGSKSLSAGQINSLRDSKIKNVSEILNIPAHYANKLLDYVKWNDDKLLAEYFGNEEELLKKAGLDTSILGKNSTKDKDKDGDSSSAIIECSVCLDDVPSSQMTTLEECGHSFCNGCWKENLELQIKEGHTFDISCMHQDCPQLVPADVVEKIVSDTYKNKYLHFLSKSFIDHNSKIRWCPAPGCEHAITEAATECRIRVATCDCGNRICWECSKEAHPPISCHMLEVFESDAKEDEKNLGFLVSNAYDETTLRWLHENTKECPFCSVSIQKHDGCYCMTCSSCSKQWCWMCRDPWETHSDHFKCSKFNAGRLQLKDKPAHQDSDTFKKRLRLQRLAFFYRLYKEQNNSMVAENQTPLKEDDARKVKQLRNELNSLDTSFIADGRLQIKKCRETLKYSYVHSYFTMSKTDNAIHYLQENLEVCIEKLAQLLQKPAQEMQPPQIRKFTKIAASALEGLQSQISMEADKVSLKKPKQKVKKESTPKTPKATTTTTTTTATEAYALL
eukprot:TRINITY_DN4200_c0_g1_i1.p1 TRINITY_DN4200_c0_g1~~TRINITY_DN4200_c0_g1_i1.p1  ORF type:complete len:739 (+),score=129.08 TRINITY_DN4200_c0_g1_i1:39-2255(+)